MNGPKGQVGWRVGVAICCLLGLVAFIAINLNSSSPSELLQAAEEAFAKRDFPTSLQLAQQVIQSDPDNANAIRVAARSAAQLEMFDDAVSLFDRISIDQPTQYVSAQCEAGDILLFRLGQLSEAEERFRNAIAVDDATPLANERLAAVLGMTSRPIEQVAFRLRALRSGNVEGIHLLSLALAESAFENPHLIEAYHKSTPDDPLVLLTLARMASEAQEFRKARELLESAVAQRPKLIVAQARLGALLIDHAADSEFVEWHSALPVGSDDSALIWVLRGRWFQRIARNGDAIRCYREALIRDANHSHANYQMGRLLVDANESEAAQPFLDRAQRLHEYINQAKIAQTGTDPAAVRAAFETAHSLKLRWEAYGWALLAVRSNPRQIASADASGRDWAHRILEECRSEIDGWPLTRTFPEDNLARLLDVSSYPLPATLGPVGGDSIERNQDGLWPVQFRNDAREAGLDFSYFNGSRSVKSGLRRMFEFAGGGAAILDYDQDGLPDIYLAQGCRWPVDENRSEHTDRLFRNSGDGRFVDVTEAAQLRENSFSHGVTVGDFDSDGWPDLYVANIGRNRLFRNNTDGTFSDVTDQAGISAEAWSTSCVMADLNDDGDPDVYTVNYLTGKDVFDRVCPGTSGGGICLPQNFAAAADELLLSDGTGGFRIAPISKDGDVQAGKGLGIIAADFHGSGRLSLFIANDTTPNQFLLRTSLQPSGTVAFADFALVSGLALNGSGRAESGMGVACGDANGDGLLDLFVTNFHAESNTLYQQRSIDDFDDVTQASSLHESSMAMVGFGSQFIDANLDGREDLVVTNGHIDSFTTEGIAYQMPPQCFLNTGEGRFQVADPEKLGPYFRGKYLGRAVTRLDWNLDGRDDLLVTHLDAPTALLSNVTDRTGNFLTVQLFGVSSPRDAIGTIVRVKVGKQHYTKQLTGGDGYLASNERILTFGLGDSARVDELTIDWPSGNRQVFAGLAANSRIAAVEGSAVLYPLIQANRAKPNR